MKNQDSYLVLGVMSGTSCDGLDLALCKFEFSDLYKQWEFETNCAATIEYSNAWKRKLKNAINVTGLDLTLLDLELGEFISREVIKFLKGQDLIPDFVACHGHTIFHQPENGITLQIGNAQKIAALTGIPVVNDFRTKDIVYGGQGAPLVPLGDQLLFSEYDACLNLGGIANTSFESNGRRLAYDVCPMNLLMNHIANKSGLEYDENGELGSSGIVNDNLKFQLDSLSYYKKPFPKSLSLEYIIKNVYPLLDRSGLDTSVLMATSIAHIAEKINLDLEKTIGIEKTVLVTGGGTHNQHFIKELKKSSKNSFVTPSHELIDFKEALVFAFLGVLRWRSEINILSSVTGAEKDSIGGVVTFPG